MEIDKIKERIYRYKEQGKTLFTTSSFQTHSLVLLHILSEIDRSIPVYFINTGYLFPKTISFRDKVARILGLKVINLQSTTPKNIQKDANGKFIFVTNPDYCCYLNKTQPMEAILTKYDIWINGVRADQSSVRKSMKIEQEAPYNCTRFHPILDWNKQRIFQYVKKYDLPRHPLDQKGYMSIGCEPCTMKISPEMHEREARWYGLNKVECGLNIDLVK